MMTSVLVHSRMHCKHDEIKHCNQGSERSRGVETAAERKAETTAAYIGSASARLEASTEIRSDLARLDVDINITWIFFRDNLS